MRSGSPSLPEAGSAGRSNTFRHPVDEKERAALAARSSLHAYRPVSGMVRSYSFAAFFNSSALSVFSHENAVALCVLPVPST